ncbi:MAG: PEP/pyruvate-binding domain-containing protein [Candidatus Sericytochromatia bacterium]
MAEPLIYTAESPESCFPFLGTQGQNLWQMAQKGLPVLPWWALSPTPFKQICNENEEQLQKLLARINLQSRLSLEQTSFQLVQMLKEWPLPSALQNTLNHALPNDGIYSLQAYIVSENADLKNLSQKIETHTCLPRQALEDSLKSCWASLFREELMLALDAQGLSPTDIPLRILIQKMIPSRASGQVLTVHPQGDLNELLIHATYGLKEDAASPLVESENYLYLRESQSWDLQVKEKWEQWVPAPEGGMTLSQVPIQLRSQAILNRPMREALVELALRTERLYKHHQALEWTQDAKGQFWLMQTRPLTSIPKGKITIFAQYALAKRYHGITSPLTYSHLRRRTTEIWGQALARLGLPTEQKSEYQSVLEHLLGHLDGRVYYHLGHWQRLFQLLPGEIADLPIWEKWLSLEGPLEHAPLPPLEWGPYSRDWWKFSQRWKPFRKHQAQEMNAYLSSRQALHEKLKNQDWSALDPHDLLALYSQICADLQTKQEVPLLNLGLLRVFASLSQSALGRAGIEQPEQLLADLLISERMASQYSALEARQQLAEPLKADPDLHDFILRHQDDPDLVKRLRYSRFEQFYGQFNAYLDNHGASTPASDKLEAIPLHEAPSALISELLKLRETPQNLAELREADTTLRNTAERRLKQESRLSPFLQAGLNHCLKQTRRSLQYQLLAEREELRILGQLRQLFNALGEKLVEASALSHPREVFLLSVEELKAFVYGHGGIPSLKARLQERGDEARAWEHRQPRAYLRTQGPVSLNQIPQQRTQTQTGLAADNFGTQKPEALFQMGLYGNTI